MRVLVVDDSVVFRTTISTALADLPDIVVAGTAANGRIALQKLEQGSIDLITLDMEMPEMSGLEVLREIRKRNFQVRVIIFSSQTQKGAESALNALKEGADDVVPKPSGDQSSFEFAAQAIRDVLLPKIIQFSRKAGSNVSSASRPAAAPLVQSTLVKEAAPKTSAPEKRSLTSFVPNVLVIGCSTGGPAALESIFSKLTAPSRIPILIVQHMPPVFTQVLAKRLGEMSGIEAAEAVEGEPIVANRIYVAPGDYHLEVAGTREKPTAHLTKNPQRNSVRPAVDALFETAATVWGASVLGFVLTGMGEDGLVGAKALRSKGGGLIIQDEESCVVFGMPGAIFGSGDYDEIMPLTRIGMRVQRAISGV